MAILWRYLLDECKGTINFAHQTFKWSNEGKGVAAVHCVIVGFGLNERAEKTLFSYDDITGEPKPIKTKNINGYLVNSDNVFFDKTKKQISNELEMLSGGKPTEGGFLLLSDVERLALINEEPLAGNYIRPFLMGNEFLNDIPRFCLWFDNIDLIKFNQNLTKMPQIKARIENVKKMRLNSTKHATQKLADTPHLFGEIRTSKSDYLALPKVSSEARKFIPIGFLDKNTISGDKLFFIPNASLYHFGIMSSSMHNAFMRLTAGRLESRYSYSNTIVYNNFPYPFTAENHDKKADTARDEISKAGQAVLDAREHYRKADPKPTLAQLYNRYLIDPYPILTKAHIDLDKAVDKAYGYKGNGTDESRVEFLLKLLTK